MHQAHAENGLAKALAEASRRRSEADAAAVDYLAKMDAAEDRPSKLLKARGAFLRHFFQFCAICFFRFF